MNGRSLVLAGGPGEGDFAKLTSSLSEEGFRVKQVKLASWILKKCKEPPALILLDLDSLGVKYLDTFKKIKKKYPSTPIILFSSSSPICMEKALRLIKEGVYDYLKKPFVMDELKILIRKALRKNIYENQPHPSDSFLPTDFILGKNSQMRKMIRFIQEVAPTEITVLIEGESGTGKEMVASIIHRLSKRQEKPFLKLNCAALTESIMESELFGYERGAFTGAENKKIGLFSAAQSGTLLLDEIAEASMNTQAKLLRVIENKEFIPVGGIAPVKCDVRLIVATNKNLEEEIEKKRFRSDLYYRINSFTISLPPLRERREDIPLFIDYFLKKHSRYFNKEIQGISSEVYQFLLNYSWPGNIRELEATLVKMIIVCRKSLITLKEVEEVLPRRGSILKKKSLLSFEEAKKSF
jgi:DNA-binding NtrC family response regulator